MKHIEVVAAIIMQEGKVFSARRTNRGPLALKWEFPGGKIEEGETKQEALKREIWEELKTVIQVGEHFMTVEHTYATFHLTLHTYLCTILKGDLTLTEHLESKWLTKTCVDSLDWAEANQPIIHALKRVL